MVPAAIGDKFSLNSAGFASNPLFSHLKLPKLTSLGSTLVFILVGETLVNTMFPFAVKLAEISFALH